MLKSSRFYKLVLLILCILLAFGTVSCSAQKKPAKKPDKSQQEKKPPKELDKLKDTIGKIEKALTKVHEENKKPFFIKQEEVEKKQKGQDKSAGGGAGGSTGDGGVGSTGGGGGSDTGGSGGGSPSPSPSPTQPEKMKPEEVKLKLEQEKFKEFEKINKSVLELHSTWNSYEPKAVSDLALQTSIKDFEMALEALTKAVDNKDDYASLLEVNQLSKYLPDFYALYEAKTPPDLDRLLFAVKKIQLLNEKSDFEAIKSTLKYLEDIWAIAKPKLKKDNMEAMNKFEFALADLKSAITAKNNKIVDAKCEVLVKILGEIEKKSKK